MECEGRRSRPASPSTASSSSVRTGNSGAAHFAFSAGSYELHDLPEKAKCIAALETNPDDDGEGCAHVSLSLDKNMSRAPLLVRSSPAQGTGSYGGLPILSMSSSPGESDLDSDHVTIRDRILRRGKRKGKSKLRESEPATSHYSTFLNRSQDESIRSEPIYTNSRTRRRSIKNGSASRALNLDFEEQEESGLEPRFNASSVASSTPDVLEYLKSSSSSSRFDDPDAAESSESDELHDLKSNGQPSDNSPYTQVRASVAATDDVSLSINTPRMWMLSMFFAILGSSTNLFFSLRFPSVSITPIIALLLVHPLGLLWDQIFKRGDDPHEVFVNGSIQPGEPSDSQDYWKRRLRLWLAQGRWNEKEHCCVYISSNVSFGFAFATDVSLAHDVTSTTCTNIGAGHCRTNKILPSGSRYCLPDTSDPINPNLGLRARRTHASISRSAKWNDMAIHIGIHSHVYSVT